MFYKFWRLTQPKEPFSPRCSDNFQNITINFDHSLLSFAIPPHSGSKGSPYIKHRKSYCLENIRPEVMHIKHTDWMGLTLLVRSCSFWGPAFTGRFGRLDINVFIIKKTRMRKGLSLYHPRVFENAVSEQIEKKFLSHLDIKHNKQDWFAPKNWQSLKQFPCVACKFDVLPNVRVEDFAKCLFLPLSDTYLLGVKLEATRYPIALPKAARSEADKWIDPQPLVDAADKILGSFHLELSAAAKQQQQKALAGVENPYLTENFPPLKWVDEQGKSTGYTEYIPTDPDPQNQPQRV